MSRVFNSIQGLCKFPNTAQFPRIQSCRKALLYSECWGYIYAMRIGYVRVSTNDQETVAQVISLESAGRDRIYREKASGGRRERPELHKRLDQLRKGDVVVV